MIEKVTQNWIQGSNPCSDGHAWGDLFVGASGKDRDTCLKSMERADWLLWLLVKTETVDLPTMIGTLAGIAPEILRSDAALTLLVDFNFSISDPVKLSALRETASKSAYALMLTKAMHTAHEMEFVALLALAMAAELRKHHDKALGLTQAACNALVGAHTGRLDFHSEGALKLHKDLCARMLTAARVTA